MVIVILLINMTEASLRQIRIVEGMLDYFTFFLIEFISKSKLDSNIQQQNTNHKPKICKVLKS